MNMKTIMLLMTIVISAVAGFTYAAPENSDHTIVLPEIRVELRPGEGKDRTEILCNICHSLDYITMQPKVPRAQWAATVNKMIKVMGAPIKEDDAKKIIDYLVANYGTGN